MKFFTVYFVFILLLLSCEQEAVSDHRIVRRRIIEIQKRSPPEAVSKDTSYLESIFSSYDLIDVRSLDSSILVQLAYSDTANFLHLPFYDGLKKAYFPCNVALAVCNAQTFLKQIDSTLSLVILDAARPLHVQQLMWDSLKMAPDLKYNYLTPPWNISLHNYGCAVDLTIMDMKSNIQLDMGSAYDHFGKISEPVREQYFLYKGELSDTAYHNRLLLRNVMKRAGLSSITSEWWHFNFCNKDYASSHYSLIK